MMFFAETLNLAVLAKGIMIGAGMIGPAIGVGLIASSYISAVGRNPETSKFLGQTLMFVAIVELMALLAFASTFIIS